MQQPVYYYSRALRGVKERYPKMENLVLALMTTAKGLRPYFQGHTIEIMIEHPMKQILHKPETSGICKYGRSLLAHKCSGIYNFFYPLTHQGSHAFHKNRRKGKRNLPLVDRFVRPSKSAPWFIRIFKGAAFLKNDHPLQVSTHEQIMKDLAEC